MADYYVILGDVVHSRKIEDREAFQERLQETCRQFTAEDRDDIWGDFKILKGIDEFGGVLQSIENLYEIVTAFQDALRPHGIRIVVASGPIDVGLTSFDVEEMDGEAFHEASERLEEIEDGPLSFDLLVEDETLGRAIADEVNLLLDRRAEWTERQQEVVAVRERVDTQTAAAQELGVSQQAVSNVLKGADWPLVSAVEGRLRETMVEYVEDWENRGEAVKEDDGESEDTWEPHVPDVPEEYLEVVEEGERFDAAAAHRMYANDLVVKGDYEEAKDHYKEALEIDSEYAAARVGYGNVLRLQGYLDDAADQYQLALEFYDEQEDERNRAGMYNNLGIIARLRGNLDEAEEYHQRSLELMRELGDRQGEANNLGNLGLVFRKRGNLDEAEEYHRRSLEIERELDNLHGEAQSLNNLGIVFRLQGDLGEAEDYHRRSLELVREFGNRHGEAISLKSLGLVARGRGELDEAEEYHRRSLEIERQVGNRFGAAQSLNNLGKLVGERGDDSSAEEHFRESIKTHPDFALPHLNLARLLANRGETAEAIERYEQYLELEPDDATVFFEYAELALDEDRHDEPLDRLNRLLESAIERGPSEKLVNEVQPQLTDVFEPLLVNATDRNQVEDVLGLLARLAERTTGEASRDVELWSRAQYARLVATPLDRADPDEDDPEKIVVEGYTTGLGYLLDEEPESAVQFLRRAWERRNDADLPDGVREYAWMAGFALASSTVVLGPSILDADPAVVFEELVSNLERLREPARHVLEVGDDGRGFDPASVAEAVEEDGLDQFARLEARAIATLLSLAGWQAAAER